MSIPYFPMYPDDFEADTAHLTLAEDGAYNRLLRLCWRTPGCKVPTDEAWIFRKMRARTDEEKEVVRVILAEFFVRKSGKFFNPRLLEEHTKAHDKHERRVLAGSKGGFAKAKKTNGKTSSNAVAKPKQCSSNQNQNQNHIKKDTNVSQKKRGTRLPDEWFLPQEWGDWALSQEWPESVIKAESEKFKDYWHSVSGQKGVKLDWFATWRNWMRNANPPKVLNGGNNESPSNTDRLQRIVTAAATGTSGKDWG